MCPLQPSHIDSKSFVHQPRRQTNIAVGKRISLRNTPQVDCNRILVVGAIACGVGWDRISSTKIIKRLPNTSFVRLCDRYLKLKQPRFILPEAAIQEYVPYSNILLNARAVVEKYLLNKDESFFNRFG